MPIKILQIVPVQREVPAPGKNPVQTIHQITSSFQVVSVNGPSSEAFEQLLPKFTEEVDKVCSLVPTTEELNARIVDLSTEFAKNIKTATDGVKDDLGEKLNQVSFDTLGKGIKDDILTDLKSYIDQKFVLLEAELKRS